MANKAITVTGVGTFAVFNQPSGPNDAAIWRIEDPLVPPMYRPTIVQRATPNKAGTNVNCSFKVTIPVTATDSNGRVSAPDTVVASATITSLQNVVGDNVEKVSKALAAAITSQLTAISAGSTTL